MITLALSMIYFVALFLHHVEQSFSAPALLIWGWTILCREWPCLSQVFVSIPGSSLQIPVILLALKLGQPKLALDTTQCPQWNLLHHLTIRALEFPGHLTPNSEMCIPNLFLTFWGIMLLVFLSRKKESMHLAQEIKFYSDIKTNNILNSDNYCFVVM